MERISHEQLFNVWFRSDKKSRQEQVCNYVITRGSATKPTPYTNEEALALFIDAQLTTHQYKLMQSQAKERNCNIYPPTLRDTKDKAIVLPTKRHCYSY
ncbi:hypothetical protein PR048_029860 [Dryococelus australis]|uniref:Uncharacterized protein n=1 Tax=Dryococelus australis TaxID=614101 RepID=A0ABQ9G7B2_9NEOP|nr:hypothetical protein PR048_029860 [Dryococelus australis]